MSAGLALQGYQVAMIDLDPQAFKTITVDNGSEFAEFSYDFISEIILEKYSYLLLTFSELFNRAKIY